MSQFAPLHPYLLTQLAEGRLSHAYVFSGAQGPEQALSLAAALCCLHPGPQGQACGSCQACHNIAGGLYPDLSLLAPEGSSYKVERMRDLVARANLSPIFGPRKCFILQEAERMGDEGANTLLKLLEEPPQGVTLMLLTQAPEALLPTIVSRCQLFVFGPAGGRREPQLPPELEQKAVSMLQGLPATPLYQVLLLAREYDGKEKETQRLFFFALLKALHAACRGQLDLPMTLPNLLRSANMCESAVAMLGPKSQSETGEAVARNINQKLLCDVVYLRLWQNTTR